MSTGVGSLENLRALIKKSAVILGELGTPFSGQL